MALGRGGIRRESPTAGRSHLQLHAAGVDHARRFAALAAFRGLPECPHSRRSPQDCTLLDLGALDGALRTVAESRPAQTRQAWMAASRVVPCRRGPVSWIIMRSSVRFLASFLAVAALALSAGFRAQAQSTAAPTTGNGTYVVVDPLAGVRYDNRFDIYVAPAYDHMKAGPTLLQGSNLGGLDVSGSYWFSKHWAIEGSGRGYLGTSGAAPNDQSINGPFVSEYFFTGGPEWL